ncbi:TetR/AcrR family transcriptional regulator [Egibacter rhizosphaerae]|uniref:TetR/AcrR family transcriptional regulator n=1 Tax=Egibacter rhizosphaerae TaxID=1670831 RepID=UPI0013F149FB|nr:TetR/AcrR family transcriptional regulator [Egibacter rhizosphaerae]
MPKIVDHEEYRAELLAGSAELFADRGFDGLTTREVADALGVSTGTIYHYFSGKRDLFLRVVEHMTERLTVVLTADLEQAEGPVARFDALLANAAAHEDWLARYNRICLDHLRERSDDGTEVMVATMDRAVSQLADALDLASGEARFLVITVFGIITQRDLDGGATSFDEQAAQLRRWLTATNH